MTGLLCRVNVLTVVGGPWMGGRGRRWGLPRQGCGGAAGSLILAVVHVDFGYLEIVSEVCRFCLDFTHWVEDERVFAIVAVMVNRMLIDPFEPGGREDARKKIRFGVSRSGGPVG